MRVKTKPKLGRPDAGFSLVELLIVVAVILTVSAIALMQVQGTLRTAKSDTALQMTLGQMRLVHERAIDERKIYRLTFTAPRTIQTDRIDVGAGGVLTPVLIGSVAIPAEIQFTLVSGLPHTAATTPDGMGVAGNAIDFSVNNGSGGLTQVYFQPDGRTLDSANRLNNGVIYICRPADLLSCRAVSLFGATGRTKGWRLVQKGATQEWRQ